MTSDECPLSARTDKPGSHSWRFEGDDPYVVCFYCDEMRDDLSGRVIRTGRNRDIPAEATP